jgi:hypothetical protein
MKLETVNTILIVARVAVAYYGIEQDRWGIQLIMLASLMHSHYIFHGKKK